MPKTPFTPEQEAAIVQLYERSSDGAKNIVEFSHRFKHQLGGFVGGQWCGMFVGIEPDGYTHT